VKVARVDIRGAGVEVVMAEDQRVNLVELISAVTKQDGGDETVDAEASAAAPELAADAEKQAAGLPPIEVGVVALHDCSAAYTDRTLTPPFTLTVDPIEGTVERISSGATAGAELDIEATVADGGSAAIKGEMDLLAPGRLTDIQVDVREAEVPPLSAMAVRYLGHPVEQGRADVGLDYEVLSNQLTGRNRIVTHDLTLGDKVEGEGTIGLPVKLGVSLLTDKEGQIEIDFPVEGRLDDPDFGLGKAIDAAVKDVMGSLVKSPFRLLGKLGGGKGEHDYGYVEFEAGSAELGGTSESKLRTLAAGAEQRPELVLVVAGAWEPEVDAAALREVSFESLLAERATEAASRVDVLESLYRESAIPERLEALRARYTSGEEAVGETPAFDETAYYRELRRLLIEAQPVGDSDLQALGAARAEAIRALLVDEVGVGAARVRVVDSIELKPAGEEWVRVELEVAAG
jgi:hypothetical protein